MNIWQVIIALCAWEITRVLATWVCEIWMRLYIYWKYPLSKGEIHDLMGVSLTSLHEDYGIVTSWILHIIFPIRLILLSKAAIREAKIWTKEVQ